MTKPVQEQTETVEGTDFRVRLLAGLEQSIREVGLQRTRIGDIVRNAGTSNRTFYECFADKETCFAELISEWSREVSVMVEAAIDPEAPWEVQIDQSVDAYLGIFASKPELAVTATRDLPALGARGVELQEADIDRYVDLMVRMTGSPTMRRAGIVPVDPWTAAMLVGGIAEVIDRSIRTEAPLESTAATIKRVLKLVIGGER